jgi:four helix bundle protein
MSKIEKFEDLIVWQEAMELVVKTYNLLNGCKDFSLRDQIQRAVVSVPSNISEGFDRQTNKEFVQFLYIAKGSLAEVRTQLYLAQKLKYIELEEVKLLIEDTRKISAMLYKLIKTRKEKF